LREPDLERICSKKRSEARKRHAVTVELADAVAHHFRRRPRPAPQAAGAVLPQPA
jgi:hypothetical protein